MDDLTVMAGQLLVDSIPHYRQDVGCPICGKSMVMLNAHDSGICPQHGEITGMDFIRTRGMSKVDALIEIRAGQYLAEIYDMARIARDEMRQPSPFASLAEQE